MKAYNRICVILSLLIILSFTVANILLIKDFKSSDDTREYRVEINRIALAIENNGLDSIDVANYEYVFNIEEYNENFYNTDSDYIIKEINGILYRFDYNVPLRGGISSIIMTNIILVIMTLFIIFLLIYLRHKILKPFDTLVDVPYQLSRGNLTTPLKEDKNRYFGKFIWGVDLLRENMESQKQRELNLQKEKKTLLLSLSHDIKTPLSAIKLYSKALSKGLYSDTTKLKEIANNIDQNADEIEAFVSQIVRASKEDFLTLDVVLSEFYLKDLIDKISSYYLEKLSLAQISFIINAYDNKLLKGDFNRAIEVLQNIIENAIKYGDGKFIEISFYDEDGCILVEIKNSGNSLSSNELPHIFESFYRGSNVNNAKGSGLGLYICRELMHKMHGDIFSKIEDNTIIITCVFTKA